MSDLVVLSMSDGVVSKKVDIPARTVIAVEWSKDEWLMHQQLIAVAAMAESLDCNEIVLVGVTGWMQEHVRCHTWEVPIGVLY